MCAHDSGCGESQRGPLACTLVIPTYGRPKWVVDAVDSALSQRRPFDEVIVVCDGPDPEVTMRLSDRPVRVVSIPKAGVAAARNAGLAAAVTPWVAFLDDDDLLHPDYLHEVAGYLRGHPDAKAINTYFWVFASRSGPGIDVLADDLEQCLTRSADVSPVTDMSYLEIRGDSYRMLLERLCGSMSTAFVAREVLLNAGGFPTGMTCAEDWTMYVHVARDHEWHVVPRRLAFFRDHPLANTRVGRSRNGLDTVRAIHRFWTDPLGPSSRGITSDAYRQAYRATVRDALDAARMDRAWGRYREVCSLAPAILPRRSDRLTALVPGELWRWARRVRDLASRRVHRHAAR